MSRLKTHVKANVVLDSSAIIADYHLRSPGMSALFKGAELGLVNLMIPEVVFAEVEAHYRDDLAVTADKLDASLRRLIPVDVNPLTAEWRNNYLSTYRLVLADMREHLGVQVLPHSQVAHDVVIKRMTDGKRPFRGPREEKGYKDFLLWNCILQYLRVTPCRLTFVTANSRDFCSQSGALHPDLVKDLLAIGVPTDIVCVVPDTMTAANAEILPYLQSDAGLCAQLNANAFDDLNFPMILHDFLEEFDPRVKWPDLVQGLPFALHKMWKNDIYDIEYYEVTSAQRIAENQLFVRGTATIEVIFEVRVLTEDLKTHGDLLNRQSYQRSSRRFSRGWEGFLMDIEFALVHEKYKFDPISCEWRPISMRLRPGGEHE